MRMRSRNGSSVMLYVFMPDSTIPLWLLRLCYSSSGLSVLCFSRRMEMKSVRNELKALLWSVYTHGISRRDAIMTISLRPEACGDNKWFISFSIRWPFPYISQTISKKLLSQSVTNWPRLMNGKYKSCQEHKMVRKIYLWPLCHSWT